MSPTPPTLLQWGKQQQEGLAPLPAPPHTVPVPPTTPSHFYLPPTECLSPDTCSLPCLKASASLTASCRFCSPPASAPCLPHCSLFPPANSSPHLYLASLPAPCCLCPPAASAHSPAVYHYSWLKPHSSSDHGKPGSSAAAAWQQLWHLMAAATTGAWSS